jgi:DNA polymerase-3 subunit gamma/tau
VFSGTRGVGKTSIARVFAKALNCVNGPTETPCNECDICRAISVGQDVDVIEIDGASNNGVEQVRELRQNAGLRPSRSRYKIYYIDEVHMLSTGAFNALLKTLEEPPEHVKFLFATTEPNKIPVTVLSRCQRFDFAGIAPEQIIDSLAQICGREGIAADRPALQAIARRAGGSMRDAQSLLEQLLSFGGAKLTSELVHQALGLAPDDRVLDILDALADHDPAKALVLLDQAASTGVQPGELLAGLLEFLRDLMIVSSGAEVDTLAAAPSQRARLRTVADRWPLDTVLAALEVLAEARARLRGSPHGRLLVELALVRVARLENLMAIPELIDRIEHLAAGGTALSAPSKKKRGPEPDRPSLAAEMTAAPPRTLAPPAPVESVAAASTPSPAGPPPSPLSLEAVRAAWAELPGRIGMRFGLPLTFLSVDRIEGPATLVIQVPPRYNDQGDASEMPESRAKIIEALAQVLGRRVTLRFERLAAEPEAGPESSSSGGPDTQSAPRLEQALADPLVMKVRELFEARLLRADAEEGSAELA